MYLPQYDIAQPLELGDLFQRLVSSTDLFDDMLRVGRPDEGLGIAVGLDEVAVDRRLELDQRAEDTALETPPGQLGEEALDRVQPRGRGRGEVEGPTRVPLQPSPDLGMLVAAIVVEDGVDQLAGRHRRLD